MRIRKIDEVRWEIPKGEIRCMKVPSRIIATEKLLNKMKRDRTLIQAAGVACLPGIYKYSIVLPDGHEGYGFPIGGVAALDFYEGAISPGGIGYDINCVAEGTRILFRDGFWIEVEKCGKVINNYLIKTSCGYSYPLFLAERYERKKGVRIVTESGAELVLSEDHPVLTPTGFVNAGELAEGSEVMVLHFEGVRYEERDEAILDEKSFEKCDEKLVEELEEKGLLPLTYSNPKVGAVARVLGFLVAKRGLKEGAKIRCSRQSLEDLKSDIAFLGFDVEVEEVQGSDVLVTLPEALAELLRKLGNELEVPLWIKRAPLWIKRNFLASLFGAILTEPATLQDNTSFYPHVLVLSASKKEKRKVYEFLLDVAELLEEFGVKTKALYEVEIDEKTSGIRLVISSDEQSLLNLYRKIGFEYSKRKMKLAMLAAAYITLRKRCKARVAIGNGFDACMQEVESFEEFCKEAKMIDLLIAERVVKVEEVKYSGKYYDIGVDGSDSTFIANSVAVHNCGVRLVRTELTIDEVKPVIRKLVDTLFKNVPSGVGSEGLVKVKSVRELDEVLTLGAKWAVEHGYGVEEDLEVLEENGCMEQADPSKVSEKAKKRGMPQLGSLGSGNHFLEVQVVDKIFNPEVAKVFGIEKEGQICVMIHTGSRGLGHQVCSDYLREMERRYRDLVRKLPDRELVYAPAGSNVAENYFKAMCCAANFAWCNRQMIVHWVRQSFEEVFNRSWEEMGMHIVYDVAHNIAKVEEHRVDGKKVKVYVHRKGATRAFPKGSKEIPKKYRDVGQPVLIPGSMGTASYVLVGCEQAMEETFGSTAHGAGREMSRAAAIRKFRGSEVAKRLERQGIYVHGASWKGIAEEAPEAYKNIDDVVYASDRAGIAKVVVRLRPIGVVKG